VPGPTPQETKKKATPIVKQAANNTPKSPLMGESPILLTTPQVAQSAHSYVQENANAKKPKTRAEARSEALEDGKEKGLSGFFSRFRREPKQKQEEVKEKKTIGEAFKNLGKRASECMNQILSSKGKHAPMKWDHFMKMMGEMGFTVDTSTAGSSVRFDPPDKNTRSISFHKPHPDPTIEPVTLRKWGKKLREYYGWSEDIFKQHMS